MVLYALAPGVSIEEFFNAPIRNTKFKITRTNPDLIIFQLIWKIYDMVSALVLEQPRAGKG